MPEANDHSLYAARLFARVGDALTVRPAALTIGDWKPLANDCHGNVSELCAHDPTYTPIRGWLYFDLGGHLDWVLFVAHSVVRAPDAQLYDITCRSSDLR